MPRVDAQFDQAWQQARRGAVKSLSAMNAPRTVAADSAITPPYSRF
jgi:hypothetical protein